MIYFGIDLGTTNSLITYLIKIGENNFDIRTIRNNKGHPLTPSVVYIEEGDNKPIVGNVALDNFDFFPERSIRWVKREMGKNNNYLIDNTNYTPQIISAFILRALKQDAEKDLQLSSGITDIVITVPADFDINSKQATIDAGKIAGFENVHLISEPNAAVLNYIFRTREIGRLDELLDYSDKYYVVFDLGGGTFDLSLIAISLDSNGKPNTSVITSSGDKYLGGLNFDIDLMFYVLNKANKLYPKDREIFKTLLVNAKYYSNRDAIIKDDVKATLARLIKECEIGKIALSEENKRTFNFVSHKGKTYRVEINREEFDNLLKPYLSKIKNHIEKILLETPGRTNNTLKSWSDIQGVLLVGGSTNIPAIKDFCRDIFQQNPIEGIDTFECVGKGASIYSAIKFGDLDIIGNYSTVVPHNYGIMKNNIFLPVLLRGSKSMTASCKYNVPFSLDTKTPIIVAQSYYNDNGESITLNIEKLNFSHPFIYTGDILDLSFSIDDDMMLSVGVKEECIDDSIEINIENNVRLTEAEIHNAIKILD